MKAYMYETMYILRPDLNEEAVDAAIGKYQTLLKEQGGALLETQHRGKRRLAYEIDRHREGIYIQMNYSGPGTVIAPLERSMRLSDEVIRYLTVKQEVDSALPEAETPAENADLTTATAGTSEEE
jgi:small subunit ribosomal protein S6